MRGLLLAATLVLSGAQLATAAEVTTENGISVICPWAEATRPGASLGTVYMDIRVDKIEQRRLTGARSELARDAELSVFRRVGGVLRRGRVQNIEIPAGQLVRLVPGGYSVTLAGLVEPLIADTQFELFVEFDGIGGFEVPVQVVAAGAGRPCGAVAARPGDTYYPLVPRAPGYVPGASWVPRGSYWWR